MKEINQQPRYRKLEAFLGFPSYCYVIASEWDPSSGLDSRAVVVISRDGMKRQAEEHMVLVIHLHITTPTNAYIPCRVGRGDTLVRVRDLSPGLGCWKSEAFLCSIY